jgi:hypothetical protein
MLDVTGDINLTGTIFAAGASGTSGQVLSSTGTGLAWIAAGGVGTTYGATNGLSLISGNFGLGGTLTQNTQIGSSTFNFDFIGLGGTQSLHIDETGRIGIGTTNPAYLLEINTTDSSGNSMRIAGNIIANRLSSNSQPDKLFLAPDIADINSSSLSLDAYGSIKFNSYFPGVGNSWASITNAASTRFQGYKNGVGIDVNIGTTGVGSTINWSSEMFFNNNGNVGLGTTNPQAKLDIGGATSTITNTSGDITLSSASGNISLNSGNLINFTQALAGSGTASAPSYSFSSDTNTGMYSGGADILRLATAGTDRLTINASGYVGIGTSIASNLLTLGSDSLNSSATPAYTLSLGSTATNSIIQLGQNSNAKGFLRWNYNATNASAYLSLGTVGQNLALLEAGGNVGVGSTNPNHALQSTITNDTVGSYFPLNIELQRTNTSASERAVGLSFQERTAASVQTILAGITGIRNNSNSNWYGSLAFLVHKANQSDLGESTLTEAMRIDGSTGNLGIGTTNPYGKLQVLRTDNASSALTVQSIGNSNYQSASIYGDFYGLQVGVSTTSSTYYALNVLSGGATSGSGITGGTSRLMVRANGNVGIGTTGPNYTLDVQTSYPTNYVMQIKNIGNTATTGSDKGLLITLGNGTSRGTGVYYVAFAGGNGTVGGHINSTGNSSVVLSTGGIDYAEYFKILNGDPKTGPGYVIQPSAGNSATKATADSKPIGVTSDNPTVIGGDTANCLATDDGTCQKAFEDSHILVGMIGQIRTYVSTENGPINLGDPLTISSTTPGIAMKATKAGYTIGTALENYSGSDTVRINVYINPSWYDPDLQLTSTGQVNVNYNIDPAVLAELGYSGSKNEIEAATYSLTDSAGKTITRLGQYAQLAVGRITAGLVSTTNLIADNIVAKNTKSKSIQTAVISPLSDISDTIVVDGNLKAKDASFSSVYADKIVSPEGDLGTVMTDKIAALRNEIRATIASLGTTAAESTPSALVADSAGWTFDAGTSQVTITGSLSLSDNLIVGSKLAVIGDSQLGNAFITGTLTAGQIAIKDNLIETVNSALYLQPSGLGSVDIMNHTLVVAENGDVTINGNLNLNGALTAQTASVSGSLFGNLIAASEITTKKLTADKINIATDSASPIIASAVIASDSAAISSISSNATAGTVTLPAGKTELAIYNPQVTSSSMVYLTPNGSTQNQVIYVKNKNIGDSVPSFTVGIDSTLPSDLSINWWIIN